ncbi:MAG TPA: HAD family phosphatase [Patescibacteria group bacterium]|nr:HAD family phosphatase [Patescibacteria group bacterium]
MYKRLIEGKKAAFFDLDGTIVDTEPLWEQAFGNVLRLYDAEIVTYNELPDGATVPQKWEYIFYKYKEYLDRIPNIKELTDLTYKEYLKIISQTPLDVRPGFWDLVLTLKEDKKLKTALVTNTSKDITQKVLEKLGVFKTFDLILTGSDIKNPKPDPEIFLTAAKNLGVKPYEVLVFEDSLSGAVAAREAGMDLVVIWDGVFDKTAYPEQTLLFSPDFEGLAGNLDLTFDEFVKKDAEQAAKESQEETTT